MKKRHIYFFHLYSCLRSVDLEIIYTKLRKLGLELQTSNSWIDCFEIKDKTETKYKIIPASISIDKVNSENYKLIAKSNRYYIFEYDPLNRKLKITNNDMCIPYFSDIGFLFAFPICISYFIGKFSVFGNPLLPNWINYLFIIAICIIYLGYIFSLLTYISQTKNYANRDRTPNENKVEFYFRILFSLVVNILQIALLFIILFGITRG